MMMPVLVLGAARSGISAVAQTIAAGLESTCIDVAGGLPELTKSIDALPSAVLCAADETAAIPNLRAARALLAKRVDLPAVIVWRQGVDFLNSRLRARRKTDFISHCLLWAASIREMEALAAAYPDRVLRVEHGQLRVEPTKVISALRAFLSQDDFRSERAAEVLRLQEPGRTVAMTSAPVCHPALTGWSNAEVEVFLEICGPLAQIDPGAAAAAERRRPLDLARALLERAKGVGGACIDQISRVGPPIVSLTLDASGTNSSVLRLPGIAAGSRRRLVLRLAVLECDGVGEARCELVESLSRRPLFAAPLLLHKGKALVADCLLPAHDGMLDFSLGHMSGSFEQCQISVDIVRLSIQ